MMEQRYISVRQLFEGGYLLPAEFVGLMRMNGGPAIYDSSGMSPRFNTLIIDEGAKPFSGAIIVAYNHKYFLGFPVRYDIDNLASLSNKSAPKIEDIINIPYKKLPESEYDKSGYLIKPYANREHLERVYCLRSLDAIFMRRIDVEQISDITNRSPSGADNDALIPRHLWESRNPVQIVNNMLAAQMPEDAIAYALKSGCHLSNTDIGRAMYPNLADRGWRGRAKKLLDEPAKDWKLG